MDKSKFTRDPQLDSEGFVQSDARCHGCAPNEQCPRSGYCERYDSPLRVYFEVDGMQVPLPQDMVDDLAARLARVDAECAANPEGWQEVDGVKLPSVSPWAELPDPLIERGHQAWVRQAHDWKKVL